MKHEQDTQQKFESLRRAASRDGRLKRTHLCACGRPSTVIRVGRRWKRFNICAHCAEAIFRTILPPPAPVAAALRRAA